MQELVTNEEVMNFVRVLAGNIHQQIMQTAYEQGQPEHPTDRMQIHAVLSGSYDSDPVIQGVLKGLTVCLAGAHEPTKTFVTSCSQTKEPFLIERLNKAAADRNRDEIRGGVHRTHIPGLGDVLSFDSPEDLLAFLARGH
jgi:hypothetical protein